MKSFLTPIGGRAWIIGALVAVFLMSACLGYRQIFSPDIGYHMATGQFVLEQGRAPKTDTFTWTVTGNRIQYMPWLFDVATYGLFRAGGTRLLTWANIVITLASFVLLLARSARREGRLAVWCAPLLAVFALGIFWEIRPHVGSWLLLNLTLLVLEEYRRRASWIVWLLPVIVLVWVNAHSLYVLGPVCIAVYVADELRRGRQADRRLLLSAGASVLACLCSPYGLSAFLYPLTQFGMLQPGHVVQSAVAGTAEFMSPFQLTPYTDNGRLVVFQSHLFIQLWPVLVVLAAIGGGRRWRLTEWLLTLAYGYVFTRAIKNHGYFVVVTFPWVAAGLEDLFSRWKQRPPAVAVMTMLLCLVVILRWHSGYQYAHERSLHQPGHVFNENHLPVRACDFMRRHLPPGRLLNNWDTGGFIHFATGWPVFVDGRTEVLGEAFYGEYTRFKILDQMPVMLGKWKPDVALVTYNSLPQWLHFFHNARGWRCVYADSRDAIYVRDGFAPDVSSLPMSEPAEHVPAFADADVERILDRAIAMRPPGWWLSLFGRHYEPRVELALTAMYLQRQQPRAAIDVGLEGLRRATFPAPEMLLNLGHAFYRVKDYPRAERCYAVFLRHERDALAEKRLAKLREKPPVISR